MCVVAGLLQRDNKMSCLKYNNYFSDKRLLSFKVWLCFMRLVIVALYLVGYCYVLFGWLLLFYLVGYCHVLFSWLLVCSIWLVTAMFY
jgi:hypothetical protein